MNKSYSLSVTFLVAANLVPILGVLFFDMSMFQIIFLYWCESGIIGFFSILKILIKTRPIFIGVFSSLFFTLHFGIFMFAHIFILLALFGDSIVNINFLSPFLFPIGVLFVSHFVSFISNFIVKGEYKQDKLSSNNLPPYRRIFIMQITIIFGGMIFSLFSTLFNTKVAGNIILILFKILIDVDAHLKSHNMNGLIVLSKQNKVDVL